MNISYNANEMCAKIEMKLLNKKDDAKFDFVIEEMSNWGWDFESTAMWGGDWANATCPVGDYEEYKKLENDFKEILEDCEEDVNMLIILYDI